MSGAAQGVTREELATATTACPRCGGATAFLAMHPIGVPNELDTSMSMAWVCTECAASFSKWWADA